MAEKDSGGSGTLGVATGVLLVAGVLYNFGFMSGLGGSLYQPKFFSLLTYLDFLEGMAYVLPTILVMAIVAGVVCEIPLNRQAKAGEDKRPKEDVKSGQEAERAETERKARIEAFKDTARAPLINLLGVFVIAALVLWLTLRAELAAGASGLLWISDLLFTVTTLFGLGVYALGLIYSLDALTGAGGPMQMFIGNLAGLAIVITLFGFFQSRGELRSETFDSEIALGDTVVKDAHIVKALSGGLFYVAKGDPGRVVYVKTDDVTRLEFPK